MHFFFTLRTMLSKCFILVMDRSAPNLFLRLTINRSAAARMLCSLMKPSSFLRYNEPSLAFERKKLSSLPPPLKENAFYPY